MLFFKANDKRSENQSDMARDPIVPGTRRKSFVMSAGIAALLAGGVAGCDNSIRAPETTETSTQTTVETDDPSLGTLATLNPDEAFVQSQNAAGEPQLVIYFPAERMDLAVDFAQAAGPLVAWAEQNPDRKLKVTGFLDDRREKSDDLPIAERRASSVAMGLGNLGIAGDRIMTTTEAEGGQSFRNAGDVGAVEVVPAPK